MAVFWDNAPCRLIETYWRFRGAVVYLSLWCWRQYAPLKPRSTLMSLHGATSHKTIYKLRISRLFDKKGIVMALLPARENYRLKSPWSLLNMIIWFRQLSSSEFWNKKNQIERDHFGDHFNKIILFKGSWETVWLHGRFCLFIYIFIYLCYLTTLSR